MSRIVCWFSCGAASAVATKLMLSDPAFIDHEIVIAYTEVKEEHPDNQRFIVDCEKWFGQKVVILRNEKYGASIYEVFEKTKFLVGPSGAACTRILKKEVRKSFERPDDIQVFGYTSEEEDRLNRFIDSNPEVKIFTPLLDRSLSKSDCLAMVDRAGIRLPAMYELGYQNNNCIGCVKAGAGYWNKIRVDFPEVFERMSGIEQSLGRSICKVTIDGKQQRVMLKDLPLDAGAYQHEPEIQCGIFCHMAEANLNRPIQIQEARHS